MLLAYQEGRRLRAALVGCGHHAYRSILPSFDYLAVDLVVTCNRHLERAQVYARRWGAQAAVASIEEVIARGDVEAVFLVVGAREHPELAVKALTAGLHVWMEKPPAEDVAGIERMLAARDASRKVAAVGFKKMFMPGLQRMKAFLDEGRFGKMRTIVVRYPMGLRRRAPGLPVEDFNDWLQNGSHALSVFVYLAGRPEALTVHASPDGSGFVVLDFPDGTVGCLHLALGHSISGPLERYEVVCEHGHMVLENNRELRVYRPGYPFHYGKTADFTAGGEDVAALVYEPQFSFATMENKALFIQGFVPELDHFVNACLGGQAATVGTLEQARTVLECYEAGLWSGGKRVLLDDLAGLEPGRSAKQD